MSDKEKKALETKETPQNNQQPQKPQSGLRPGRRGGGGGPGWALSTPVEKAKDFKGSISRLIKYLSQYKVKMALIVVFITIVVIVAVIGPNYTRFIMNDLQAFIMGKLPKEEALANILK